MSPCSAVDAYRGVQRLRDKCFSLAVARAFAAFGDHTVLQPPVRLLGEASIAIGSGVFIGSNSWLQVIGDTEGGLGLEIGDGTSIAGHCVLSAASAVRLGASVLLGRNVYVADHNHAFADPTRPILAQGSDKVAAVESADGAWLGQNCVVTPGVRVGRGAVVGANSVVTESVPDRCLAVGAPARVVRRLR